MFAQKKAGNISQQKISEEKKETKIKPKELNAAIGRKNPTKTARTSAP